MMQQDHVAAVQEAEHLHAQADHASYACIPQQQGAEHMWIWLSFPKVHDHPPDTCQTQVCHAAPSGPVHLAHFVPANGDTLLW